MSAAEAALLTNPPAGPTPTPTGAAAETKLLVLKAGSDASFVEYAYLAPKHLKRQFKDICSSPIDKQAEYWLKSFVKEFTGKVPDLMELAEEFKAYLPDDGSDQSRATSLDAFQAHVYLERKGEVLSAVELRRVMRDICADDADVTRFSFIEYLVWSYQKTLAELFVVKPHSMLDEPLLRGLHAAMHNYQEAKAQHDAKTEELKEAVEEHGSAGLVVKGLVAQAALKELITRGGSRRCKDSVYHKYKQKKAQKQFEDRREKELAAKKLVEKQARVLAKQRMAAKMGGMDAVDRWKDSGTPATTAAASG